MEGFIFFFILCGFVLLFIIWVLLGAYVWPGFTKEIVESYELLASNRTRNKSLLYAAARWSKNIYERIHAEELEREEAEHQRKIEENKAAVSWKCLGCGRVNHGFQEMCACGQRRDDN